MAHKTVWDNIAQGHLFWNHSLPTLVIVTFYMYFKLTEIAMNLEKAEKRGDKTLACVKEY